MMDETSRETRLFKRREKAVTASQRLPTAEELLRGMPFFRDSLTEDRREFGDRLPRRLRRLRRRKHPAGIITCLEELSVKQSQDSVRALEAELDGSEDSAGVPVETARLRCLLYRGGFGDPDAAAVAGEMALLERAPPTTGECCGSRWTG